MKYKILPLMQGYNTEGFDLSNLIYRHPIGETFRMYNGFFAIQGNGETMLVDAGTATNEECAKTGHALQSEEKSFLEALADAGIDANEIRKVFLTHLHWDHCWNMDKLPNATFYVQRRELQHAVAPYKHERGSFGFSPAEGYRQPQWMIAAERIVAIDGETVFQPGIRLLPTPGHTHGSQSVLVDTDEGTYAIVGDFCLTMQNWNDGIQVGLFVSSEEWYHSYKTLRSMELAGIMTTHDSITYQRKVWG